MIKKNAHIIRRISGVVGFLFLVNTIVNLIFSHRIYSAPDLYHSFFPNDLINLIFGLPILIFSMMKGRKGHKLGLIGWATLKFTVLF